LYPILRIRPPKGKGGESSTATVKRKRKPMTGAARMRKYRKNKLNRSLERYADMMRKRKVRGSMRATDLQRQRDEAFRELSARLNAKRETWDAAKVAAYERIVAQGREKAERALAELTKQGRPAEGHENYMRLITAYGEKADRIGSSPTALRKLLEKASQTEDE
jgi:hypothetical protein